MATFAIWKSAAAAGDEKSQLALDVFVEEIRRHMGGMIVAMGGVDAIVFTGGIGEKGAAIRAGVCADLAELGIEIDWQPTKRPPVNRLSMHRLVAHSCG